MKLPLRYSLRNFLLLLVLPTAALGLWTKRSVDQSRHVGYLQGLGLAVSYDMAGAPGGSFAHRIRLWLAARLGKDVVAVPVAIATSETARDTIYTEDFAVLAHLIWLRRIELAHHQEIDDEAIAHLARLRRIESLT